MSYKTTWERIRVEATTDPFGDSNSEQGIPHPSWWPTWMGTKESSRIEESLGFPRLSWWELERGSLFHKMPKMNIETMRCPTEKLYQSMPQLLVLAKNWADSASKLPPYKTPKEEWLQVIEPMCRFWDSGGNESHYNEWSSYLIENCLPQLQFFGVPFRGYENLVFNDQSNFFKKPLKFIPGKWEIMVVFSLMIAITHQIEKNIFTPFLPWPISPRNTYVEKSSFQFPIVQWLKTKNIQQIKLTLNSLRGKNQNIWFNVKNEVPPGVLNYLTCFGLFLKFYETESGFSRLNTDDIYDIFNGPEFRRYYGFMIWMSRLSQTGLNFDSIKLPNNILDNPFANMKSVCDFMIWSLMTMYVDAFHSNVDVHVNVRKIINQIEVSQSAYENVFRVALTNTETVHYWQPQQVKPAPPPPIIPSGIHPGTAVPEDIVKENERIKSMVKEFGLSVDYQSFTHITNLRLDRWLSDFRVTWRKTAIWNFLGVGDQEWESRIFQYNEFPKGSKEEKIVLFIRDNFPRKLKIPRYNIWELNSLDSKWEDAFKYQFELYLEWVVLNVNVEHVKDYVAPGNTFVDKQGLPREVSDGETTVYLKNSFPDIMMREEQNLPGKIFQKSFSFAFVFLNAALEKGFGSDWIDLLSNFGKKIWEGVKEALIELAKWVKEVLDDAIPNWESYLALALVGFFVVYEGWSFADEKIRKLAR